MVETTKTGDHPNAEDIRRFADGAINDQKLRELSLHLEECDGCRQETELVQEGLRLLSMLAAENPPARLPGVEDVFRRAGYGSWGWSERSAKSLKAAMGKCASEWEAACRDGHSRRVRQEVDRVVGGLFGRATADAFARRNAA